MSATHVRYADALLREAHGRTYRFPAGFAGFEALLHWVSSTDEGSARVVIRPGAEQAVAIDGEAPEWVENELRSIVGHRTARPYEQGDGAVAKRISGERPALGTMVELEDAFDSSYVVEDGRIALVTRTAHGSHFSIAVQERVPAPDGSALPTAFCVFSWDEDGRLGAAEAYTDEPSMLGGVLVPASRTVTRADADGLVARRLRLTEHVSLGRGEAS